MADNIELWLRLVHTTGVGPRHTRKLLQAFGTVEEIFSASVATLRGAGISETLAKNVYADSSAESVAADIKWSQADDCSIISQQSPHYPARLAQIADAPPVLFVRGDPQVLQAPQLAIVGSRKPTPSAGKHAAQFAADLAGYGITITSGLAYGIDVSAHRGALNAGGLTIAVTGTGLDRVYPAQHRELAHEIAANGALVSEFAIGTSPKPAHFPRRNRIISGLSHGVLVVEAALKSGSLTTAAHATEQSREVFAVPGSIDNPLSRGCHALLRRGAILVESSTDVLEHLAPMLPATFEPVVQTAAETDDQTSADTMPARRPPPTKKTQAAMSETTPPGTTTITPREQLLDALGYDPVSLDTLVERTGFDIISVTNLATELELDGKIQSVAGGNYLRV